MKVAVSTAGKFHAFHLAEELQKRGCLARLMTSFYDPEGNGRGYNLHHSLVRTHFLSALLTYAPRIAPPLENLPLRSRTAHEVYDRWAARNLPQADIIVAWSGWALHTHRAAKRRGMITVVERGSAHVERQKEILAEEYERLAIRGPLPSNYIRDKEVQEYEEADYISGSSLFCMGKLN